MCKIPDSLKWGYLAQVVCITDPVLATQVLRSKVVDKLRFQYSFLDPVRTCSGTPAATSAASCMIICI